MLDMLKRHEIQVLRKAGHKATEVAALAGVSRRSVGLRVRSQPEKGRIGPRLVHGET